MNTLRHVASGLLWLLVALFATPAGAQEPKKLTILYDAFGPPSALTKDWGFAAFVEYGGRRILFDTGNDGRIFAANVRSLGIDLTRLDAVVISHRHDDHTSGLNHLIEQNPGVRIYAPQEGAFFKGPVPVGFLKPGPELPVYLRYFDGKPPERLVSGTPWEKGNFAIVTSTTEIFPGFFVFSTRSQKPGTLEMNEVSLAFRTPEGLAVIVGCSHPGVEKILEEAAKIDPRLYSVTGGFHLVMTPPQEVRRTADLLYDVLGVRRVAPGHCTSELGLATFMERFKDRFDVAGVGVTLALP